MIEKPEMLYALLITLLPAVVGCGSTVAYFLLGGNKNRGFIPMLACVFFIVLSMWYFDDKITEYNDQVEALIHETKCNDLPQLANEYEDFKSDIIDEIVLRCLVGSDTQLTLFVKENGI